MSQHTESLGRPPRLSMRWVRRDRPIMAYGLMLVVAVSLVLNYFIKFPSMPSEAASTFRKFNEKRLRLQVETDDAVRLERFFAAEDTPLRVRTPDPTAYALKGASVQRILNRKTAGYMFQNRAGHSFVVLAYPGNTGELPVAGEVRQDTQSMFRIYPRQGVTSVFWQEEDLCFILVSEASVEENLRVAHAISKH